MKSLRGHWRLAEELRLDSRLLFQAHGWLGRVAQMMFSLAGLQRGA